MICRSAQKPAQVNWLCADLLQGKSTIPTSHPVSPNLSSYPNRADPSTRLSGGCLVKFEQLMKQGFAPMVAVASGDVTFNAVVDTGLAEALSLPIPLLEKTGKDGMIEGKGVMGGGAFEDNNKSRLVRLNSFRAGNTEFGKVVAAATEKGKLPLIDTEFLSRFVVTLNYPAGEMLLVPSDGDKPRDNVSTTGIGVVRDASGKALVSGVWSGSPADRLGIMARDEIAAINGKPASDYGRVNARSVG